MPDSPLYLQIAESIRRDILEGRLKPGCRLPSVRELHERWNCTPGTIQRAYRELVRQGLLESHAGQGTRVTAVLPPASGQAQTALRRAQLVHRMEAVILEAVTAGYSAEEIQQALGLALDRWRAIQPGVESAPPAVLRFVGSHDPALTALAEAFNRAAETVRLELAFSGSLGGLIALAEGRAELAGCHLWDRESDTYNWPYIRKLLPGRDLRVVTLAHRRLGLIVAPGNPLQLHSLADLPRPGVRFVNRQSGSGTRVWLDAMLAQNGIERPIQGYTDERLTHTDVARTVAEGQADAGLGLEAAARAFGLDFIFLTRERYDLVLPAEAAERPAMRQFLAFVASPQAKRLIESLPGYETQATGKRVEPAGE